MIKILLKFLLLLFILAVTFMPQLQRQWRFVDPFPLKGSLGELKAVSKMDFDFRKWLNGEFQEQNGLYLERNFGLRDYYIRIYNQIAYSLWRTPKAQYLVIGKKDFMYEKNYIDAYYGNDFIGSAKIAVQTERLRMLQDTLRKLNISLLVVLAPGKADFFPEYIPNKFHKKRDTTNFEVCKAELEKQQVNVIDFNTWFIKNKYKAKYPLYGQYGIHWSMYGSMLAADSVFKTLESLCNIDMPDVECNFIDYSSDVKRDDYDCAAALNILVTLQSYKMAYPIITVRNDSTKIKPNILVIGDSYYYQFINNKFTSLLLNNNNFWFYFKKQGDFDGNARKVQGKELQDEIEKQNAVVLLSNVPNLKDYMWGFIDDAYDAYFGANQLGNSERTSVNDTNEISSSKLAEYKASILKNPKWLKAVKQNAKKNHVTLDEQVKSEAIWMEKNINK